MEENKEYVVDASIVIKWMGKEMDFLEEALTIRNLWQKGLIKIIVPSHFESEVMNFFTRKFPEDATDFFSFLKLGGVVIHLLNLQVLLIAEALVKKYDHISFYDAFYHALAKSKSTSFITSDKKYYEKVKKEGSIVFLKDVHDLFGQSL